MRRSRLDTRCVVLSRVRDEEKYLEQLLMLFFGKPSDLPVGSLRMTALVTQNGSILEKYAK